MMMKPLNSQQQQHIDSLFNNILESTNHDPVFIPSINPIPNSPRLLHSIPISDPYLPFGGDRTSSVSLEGDFNSRNYRVGLSVDGTYFTTMSVSPRQGDLSTDQNCEQISSDLGYKQRFGGIDLGIGIKSPRGEVSAEFLSPRRRASSLPIIREDDNESRSTNGSFSRKSFDVPQLIRTEVNF